MRRPEYLKACVSTSETARDCAKLRCSTQCPVSRLVIGSDVRLLTKVENCTQFGEIRPVVRKSFSPPNSRVMRKRAAVGSLLLNGRILKIVGIGGILLLGFRHGHCASKWLRLK